VSYDAVRDWWTEEATEGRSRGSLEVDCGRAKLSRSYASTLFGRRGECHLFFIKLMNKLSPAATEIPVETNESCIYGEPRIFEMKMNDVFS
jgi:hypothetical protein